MKALKTFYNEPGYCIFGVCNKFIWKLTDYFFIVLDEGTALVGNRNLFIEPKENSTLIKHFGPMYVDFDKYPSYSGTISESFGNCLMLIFSVISATLFLKSKTTFAYGLMRKVGKSCQNIFLMLSK